MKNPTLRFPGSKKDWQKEMFGRLVSNKPKKYNPKTTNEKFRCIELENIESGKGRINGYSYSNESKSIKNIFYENQVLFGKLRPYLNKYWLSTFRGVCSTEIWVMMGEKISNNFLVQLIQTSKFMNAANISFGSKMPRADWSYISNIDFNYPPDKDEQSNIGNFLSVADNLIESLELQKEKIKNFKKASMQQIFTQKKRFKNKNGEQFPKWEKSKLSKHFERVTRKNSNNIQNVLTISAQSGLINQEKYFNKSVAAKDLSGYYLLFKDEFAYNKSYSMGYPIGAIKKLNDYDKGVVSTLYICFRLRNALMSSAFFEYYFEIGMANKEIHKIAQEGARAHGLLNMSIRDFFDIEILVPSVKEQETIADFLSSIDSLLEIKNKQIAMTKQWKKGLLQQMFV